MDVGENNMSCVERHQKNKRKKTPDTSCGDDKNIVGIDDLSDEILQIVVSYLITNRYASYISFWPWRLHVVNSRLMGRISWFSFDLMQQTWQNYYVLCSLNRRWRQVTEHLVEEIRMTTIKSRLQASKSWDFFELIYQPPGYSLPEVFGESQRPWTTLPDGGQLPPQGLLFLKSTCRNNACSEVFHVNHPPSRTSSPFHMAQMAGWRAFIPPCKLDGVGVIRLCNQFIEEQPVHVRKRIGTHDFCVKKEGPDQPYVLLENETIEVPTSQIELPLFMKRQFTPNPRDVLLILVKRQGEDCCANFLRKFLPSNENPDV